MPLSMSTSNRMHVATPVDWKVGADCMVLPGVKQEDAIEMFPRGLKTHQVPSGKVLARTRQTHTGLISEIKSEIINLIIFHIITFMR